MNAPPTGIFTTQLLIHHVCTTHRYFQHPAISPPFPPLNITRYIIFYILNNFYIICHPFTTHSPPKLAAILPLGGCPLTGLYIKDYTEYKTLSGRASVHRIFLRKRLYNHLFSIYACKSMHHHHIFQWNFLIFCMHQNNDCLSGEKKF